MRNGSPRQRILDATRRVMQEGGRGLAVTIGEVAAEAGVSRATLYRHFSNRAALIQAALGPAGGELPPLDTRSRVLEAALDVFGERGFHAATLAEIAARAGLSLSGLHWHFRNKDELVAELAHHIPILLTFASEVDLAQTEEADLEAQLTRIANVVLGIMGKRRGLIRLMLCEAQLYPDVARLASSHTIGRGLPLLTRLFEAHARRGTVRPGPSRARAQAFMGMFALLALLRPAFDAFLEPDDLASAREYVQIFLRGVLADPQGRP